MVKMKFIPFLLALVFLSGCSATSLSARRDAAEDLARTGALTGRVIKAGLFNLSAWERITQPGAPVAVYIEGDGLAWLNTRTKSLNPTPVTPQALRLAALDKAPNVVYLARPCQYTGWNNGGACPDLYWTNGRTAAEVIFSYNLALDDIKARSNASAFSLTGYSGGAAVAALVAAERSDVSALRTVAGNLDYTLFSSIDKVSPLDASRNPVEAAAKIAHIPQLHFMGETDTVVPAAIFNSWQQASGATTCIQSMTVPATTHEKGWAEKWPELLAMPAACAPAAEAPPAAGTTPAVDTLTAPPAASAPAAVAPVAPPAGSVPATPPATGTPAAPPAAPATEGLPFGTL